MNRGGIRVDVNLMIDDRTIAAPAGANLLSVCLENDIYIPHLCHLPEAQVPAANCRLCFVELQGMPAPAPACTIQVEAGMRVQTATAAVRRLQRTALRLLLSTHHIDCKNCHAHRACELQNLARFLKIGLRPHPLPAVERPADIDTSHPLIDHYPHRCVLCGKCVRICRNRQAQPLFSFGGRGIDTVVHHYPGGDDAADLCADCRGCIAICPVGALKLREGIEAGGLS
jgi:NADH dehydrogenase/NADH:ubiquinone oxidoreductase subunit G